VIYYRKKRNLLFFFYFFLGIVHGQCVPTFTDSVLYNPVCSFQWVTHPSGGQVRINLSPLTFNNTYTFTTVGESSEDTFLALYNSSGVLLASNDDASDCIKCKQSTIQFNSQAFYSGAYVIISKSGCLDLNNVIMRFNAINNYDPPPKIIEPEIPFYPCKSKSVYLKSSAIVLPAKPWSSSDPSLATVDPETGEVKFLKEGIVKIKLRGNLNCETIKTYNIINIPQTSVITHD
ncbi:hypothetical protein, partial [Flavobacterium sp. UGB4466]|uniref:hypothetical protein n=1 Tax=Flavobacterium sp. UGB4466 TaxID=2730889 RepID=UPI001ED9068B